MPTYYDASFLLSGFLETVQPVHHSLWDDESVKFSSNLLEAECVTVLRRVAATRPEAAEFLTTRLEYLDRCLASIHLATVNNEVLRRLRNEPPLAACRTLDALHLVTALLFQDQLDEPLTVCTLDNRMRATAQALGFPVNP